MRRALTALALVSALALVLAFSACGNKSEHALRQQFKSNKVTLSLLLDMQLQDKKVVRIAPSFTRLESDWSWPRNDIGFTKERWDTYRMLFERASISDGIQKDGEYVWYFVSSTGLAIAGTSRGFVFTKASPKPLVRKFDDCPKEEGICYLALENNWYLFQWQT